jgi:hypothetical protein
VGKSFDPILDSPAVDFMWVPTLPQAQDPKFMKHLQFFRIHGAGPGDDENISCKWKEVYWHDECLLLAQGVHLLLCNECEVRVRE